MKKENRNALFSVIFLTLFFFGCGSTSGGLNRAISLHRQGAQQIRIGDSKSSVLHNLRPAFLATKSSEHRTQEMFMRKGKTIEIHYVRSGWIADGANTDDEYTPYIFEDDVLVAIGWRTLGGAKTRGNTAIKAAKDNRRRGRMLKQGLRMMRTGQW